MGGLLALLLLAGGGIKEWVHACAPHPDTVHHHRNDGQLAFEAQHHHCDFLSYCFAPFVPAEAAGPVFHTGRQATWYMLPPGWKKAALQPCGHIRAVVRRQEALLLGLLFLWKVSFLISFAAKGRF